MDAITTKPAFENNNVAVFLTCSDLYSPFAGVLIQSIYENSSRENNYDILVFHSDVSQQNQKLIETMISAANFKVRFVDVSDIMDSYTFTYAIASHSKYNFYRLSAMDVLPEYNKVIYMDSDIIVEDDIAKLYNTDVNGYYVAASRDFRMIMHYTEWEWTREYVDQELQLKNPLDYFNAGVILYNLEEMRKQFTVDQLMKKSTERTWLTSDQDVQNILYEGKIKHLQYRWNLPILSHDKTENIAPPEIYQAYLEARRNPAAIHFLGNRMPINEPDVDFYQRFWKYASMTPFYQLLLERQEEALRRKRLYVPKDAVLPPQKGKRDADRSVAIFVSHQIDWYCGVVECDIYKHIRRGAFFNKNRMNLMCDNIGDHISDKCNAYNDLTVQYWAWKNYKADYYGLAQFNQYLSLNEKKKPLGKRNDISVPTLNHTEIRAHKLADHKRIQALVNDYDVLGAFPCKANEYIDLAHTNITVYDMLLKKPNPLEKKTIDEALLVIQEQYPQYEHAAESYLKNDSFYSHARYIMRKDLFFALCDFQFGVLDELDKRLGISENKDEYSSTSKSIGVMLFGIYMDWLTQQKDIRIKHLPLLRFKKTKVNRAERDKMGQIANKVKLENKHPERRKAMQGSGLKQKLKGILKKVAYKTIPAYRVSLRVEQSLIKMNQKQNQILTQFLYANEQNTGNQSKTANPVNAIAPDRQGTIEKTLTAHPGLELACFAREIGETHRASFSEFKYCNIGKSVVVVATGPTLRYYDSLENAVHIGTNKAFKAPGINLDYYFTTDYHYQSDWFDELKDLNCVKFFGQFSIGSYREKMQITEKLIRENNARRYFQGAPSENIHINIEFYPLMAFYSVVFQAIHFSLYTYPKRIFLAGCDCTAAGYFDGESQTFSLAHKWIVGYKKLKEFVEQFYPDIEIISINPVGLRGLFRDVYTRSYLENNPDIDSRNVEILEESDLLQE